VNISTKFNYAMDCTLTFLYLLRDVGPHKSNVDEIPSMRYIYELDLDKDNVRCYAISLI
jgi:hypothetical protein